MITSYRRFVENQEVQQQVDVFTVIKALAHAAEHNPRLVDDLGAKSIHKVEFIPEAQAREIITGYTHYKSGGNLYPSTRWADWFQGVSRSSKKYIVEDIKKNQELRNAMLSIFYTLYKQEANYTASFETFLYDTVTIRRGISDGDVKGAENEGFESFTISEVSAKAWEDKYKHGIKTEQVRPIDTYGAVNYMYGSEIEILKPIPLLAETYAKQAEQYYSDWRTIKEIQTHDVESFNKLQKASEKDDYITVVQIFDAYNENKQIAQAYIKAKEDGSNPELVKDIEKLL